MGCDKADSEVEIQHVHFHRPNAALLTCSNLTTPKSYKTALQTSHWKEAMQQEIQALHENHTWDLVPRPSNTNIIGSKWVFRIKFQEDGSVERYKARLVAQGYSQIEGLDYTETYSPVVKATTIRVVLTIATTSNWKLRQLDVKNAFLHGYIKETIYMEQPPGFQDPQKSDSVCKLNKSLYGLKQAPRAWFNRLSHYLLHLGFICSSADSSLFILHHNHIIILMLIYVDDIVLTGNDDSFIHHLITKLSSEFSLKDLGELQFFLGIEV